MFHPIRVALTGHPDGPELDLLVRDGFERPAQSLAALGEWQRVRASTPAAQRAVLQAIGSVHAQSGATVEAGTAAEQLLALARDDTSGRSDPTRRISWSGSTRTTYRTGAVPVHGLLVISPGDAEHSFVPVDAA